jgi:hypothetical protein
VSKLANPGEVDAQMILELNKEALKQAHDKH